MAFDFPPVRGGISSFLLNIAQSLSESVVVLTERRSESPTYSFRVYRERLISSKMFVWPKWLPLLWHIYRIVKREGIHILQIGQILPFGTCALVMKKIFGIPYIVYIYGNDLIVMRHAQSKMRQIRAILKNADAVIGCSHYSARLAVQTGAPEEHTHVVYPCPTINPPTAYNHNEVEQFAQSNHLAGKRILLTVGNLVQRKSHDMVIKSLPEVLKKHPDAVYVIVGVGPQLHHIQHEVAIRQLEPYVKFFTQVTHHDLQMFYRACDLFVMPSRMLMNSAGEPVDVEGFGIVFLEANLYQKPVIGGDSGGVPEAIKNGYSGLTVDPTNSHEISSAIDKLLSDSNLAELYGRQGRERALDKFDWNHEIKKLKSLLEY